MKTYDVVFTALTRDNMEHLPCLLEDLAATQQAPPVQAPEMPRANDPNDLYLDNAPASFICPITLGLLCDPVMASDTHTYDRTALEN
jgi:hypothetical protein